MFVLVCSTTHVSFKYSFLYYLRMGTIIKSLIAAAAAMSLSGAVVLAQERGPVERRHSFEIGLSGAGMNYNRVYMTGFSHNQDGSYTITLENKQVYGGVNLYLAWEAASWLYVDGQATYGIAKYFDTSSLKDVRGYSGMAGLGLQVRPFYKSQWIQPYLRAGLNYYTKDFPTSYYGTFVNDPTGQAKWVSEDTWNEGRTEDVDSFYPLSLGAGVIGWISNRVGVRLQADYCVPVFKEGVNFAMGTAGLVVRLGGKDKRRAIAADYYKDFPPAVEYVDRVVEKVVEKPVEVEKIVEKVVEKRVEVPAEKTLAELMRNVTFEFDRDVITPSSNSTLDQVARIIKEFPDTRFLVAGYTDAKGSAAYNEDLSNRRARAVYNALIARGVSPDMIRYKGFGKRVALIPATASDLDREGDRKVVIETVTNAAVWNYLGK